jgi:ribosome-interacting GTPase 1
MLLLLAQTASYEFTTLTCVPGIVRYRGARLQMLDLPGIIEGAKDGKGRGRQVRSGLLFYRFKAI